MLLISKTKQMCCKVFSQLPPEAPYPPLALLHSWHSQSNPGHVCLFHSFNEDYFMNFLTFAAEYLNM